MGRRYGPLPGLAIALLLVATVLPSALNIPQSNPTTTPEFAPVPPQDQKQPPPDLAGNVAGVGLASGSGESLGQSDPGDPGIPPPADVGSAFGKQPTSKECVGNPPRQSEDPLAPPCVGYFKGDNGGATYTGVSGKEITTLFVYDAGTYLPTSKGQEDTPPAGTYVDLFKPPSGEEMIFLKQLRLWQTYFDQRFQTYNRRVHFWVYFADGDGTPERRRAIASENFKKLRPFAVFFRSSYAAEPYTTAMARNGVMNFGGYLMRPDSSFSRFPKQNWSYSPSVEQRARDYASFVCRKIAPYPASFSGNAADNGKPRKYGLIYIDSPQFNPEFLVYSKAVEQGLSKCSVGFGGNRLRYVFKDPDDEQETAVMLAQFKRDGVTTVLTVAGQNTRLAGETAAGISYFPEWVYASDTRIDATFIAQQSNQRQMASSWVVSPTVVMSRYGVLAACSDAATSVDPNINVVDWVWYCTQYDDLRTYFTAIQVAGPRLTPDAVDQGFRAIPPYDSPSPQTPACYFEVGSYTCVKDAIAQWWDPSAGNSESKTAGCWRAMLGGRRFRAGRWPAGDVSVSKNARTDPCNTYLAQVT